MLFLIDYLPFIIFVLTHLELPLGNLVGLQVLVVPDSRSDNLPILDRKYFKRFDQITFTLCGSELGHGNPENLLTMEHLPVVLSQFQYGLVIDEVMFEEDAYCFPEIRIGNGVDGFVGSQHD